MAVDLQDLRELERAIRITQQLTKRSAKQAVTRAGIALAASAGTHFKKRKSSTKRTFFKDKIGDPSKPWVVIYLKQFGPPTSRRFAGNTKRGGLRKTRPPIKPENIGLAWRSWKWIKAKLPGSRGSANLSPAYGNRKGVFQVQNTGSVDKSRLNSKNPLLIIINKLTYLETHVPGLSRMAITSASNQLIKKAEEGFEKAKRSWR